MVPTDCRRRYRPAVEQNNGDSPDRVLFVLPATEMLPSPYRGRGCRSGAVWDALEVRVSVAVDSGPHRLDETGVRTASRGCDSGRVATSVTPAPFGCRFDDPSPRSTRNAWHTGGTTASRYDQTHGRQTWRGFRRPPGRRVSPGRDTSRFASRSPSVRYRIRRSISPPAISSATARRHWCVP